MLQIAALLLLLGQSSEPMSPTPIPEVVKDESECTPILQKFRGMQLAEAKIDVGTGLLRMVYYRKLNAHSVLLFLVVREACAGPYKIVNVHTFDPDPVSCPEGSVCI